jgi:hypothetical protein
LDAADAADANNANDAVDAVDDDGNRIMTSKYTVTSL